MEAINDWLLPGLLVAIISTPVVLVLRRESLVSSSQVLTATLLAVCSLVLLIQSRLSWSGPTLFALDSFHQIRIGLSLTLGQMPLMWVAWWWMRFDTESNKIPSSSGALRAITLRASALACLMISTMADDLWFFFTLLIIYSLLQDSVIQTKSLSDHRTSLLRGCHWLGVLFLLVSFSILSFDFGLHAFGDLPSTLSKWDQLSSAQHADLHLALMLAVLAVLLMGAVFPVSVLRIDHKNTDHFEVLGTLSAAVMCFHFSPLLAISEVSASQLVMLTLVTSILCSWNSSDRSTATRSLTLAFVMLGFAGLLMTGSDPDHQMFRLLGLEQVALALILWRLWSSESWKQGHRSRSEWLFSSLLAGLLICGLSGWQLAVSTSDLPLWGWRLDWLGNALIAAGLSYGWMTEVVLRSSPSKFRSVTNEVHSPRQTAHSWHLSPLITLLILFSIRVALRNSGLPWLVFPEWTILAGFSCGCLISFLVLHNKSESEILLPSKSTFQAILQSQFHMLTLWDLISKSLNTIMHALIAMLDLVRSRRRRSFWGRELVTQTEQPFVWEFALGTISLIVLASLFLWPTG